MPLNLVLDAWIPVQTSSGRRTIRPDQIAEPGVLEPDWPRADLNLACLEMLIGLVYLACPPGDTGDWRRGRDPDAEKLRAAMAPLAPAFNLVGDGPLFMQDLEVLKRKLFPPDMLFIDSAGANAAKNNADLMVRRERYPVLDLPLAAMAIYTLQTFAPSGGAGNRTSMRGGGPMVTLVEPHERGAAPLWSLVWANVPDGQPSDPDNLDMHLPWLRPTRISEKGHPATFPPRGNTIPAEAFFGMPRRLRLVVDDDLVTGVMQKPYGTNYAGWVHPLAPYYQVKASVELLPMHPRPGVMTYHDWPGVVLESGNGYLKIAHTVQLAAGDRRVAGTLRIGGWAMDNMKPRDFVMSRQPLVAVDNRSRDLIMGLIHAADLYGRALRLALQVVLRTGSSNASAIDIVSEEYFLESHPHFERCVSAIQVGSNPREEWLSALRRITLKLFEPYALASIGDRRINKIKEVVSARKNLENAFAGRTKIGREAWAQLELEPPAMK